MNYKSLNSAIRSVINPQPKNEALHSLQENIDLYNAVLPYTVGLQSVIVLAMIEALLDGSGPISGTVSLFKNLMKKWKARVLGGKLSADQAQSFIAEYEKLSASLPTGKRNFLKASLNKMEQAAKAGDKSKLGAIATEVKDYLSRNSAEVKEDYQTRERDRQMANTGQLGSSLDSKEKASKKVYGKDGVVAHKSLRSMIKKANWKDEKNRLAVKEDIQTPERNAQMTKALVRLGGEHNGTSPAIKKQQKKQAATYSRDRMERQSSNLYDKGGKIIKKKSTVKEEQEYIERLEFALEAIAEELECSVEDLLEDVQTRDRQVQMKRKLKRSDNLVGKANAEVNKRERAEDRAYSNLSADDDFLKVAKTSDRADTARDNRERTDKTHSSLVNLNSRERKSKKLFGKGGKVIKKA